MLKSYLNGGNTTTNTWAVVLVRYTAAIVNWTRHELLAMDSHTRKLLTCGAKVVSTFQGREHPVMENKKMKILWDFNVETDHAILHGRSDIVVLGKKEKNALLIDIAVLGDVRAGDKEGEKVMFQYFTAVTVETSVKVIPIVVGALGTVPKKLELYLERGGIEVSVGLL